MNVYGTIDYLPGAVVDDGSMTLYYPVYSIHLPDPMGRDKWASTRDSGSQTFTLYAVSILGSTLLQYYDTLAVDK